VPCNEPEYCLEALVGGGNEVLKERGRCVAVDLGGETGFPVVKFLHRGAESGRSFIRGTGDWPAPFSGTRKRGGLGRTNRAANLRGSRRWRHPHRAPAPFNYYF